MPSLPSTPGQITATDAHDLAHSAGAVLLDVRDAAEYAAGRAPGAVHLPLVALAAGAPLPAGCGGRTVLAICRTGHRSQLAAELLAARGVAALNVVGGMTAWAHAGLPVTTPGGDAGLVI